jgi:hypothetical protein
MFVPSKEFSGKGRLLEVLVHTVSRFADQCKVLTVRKMIRPEMPHARRSNCFVQEDIESSNFPKQLLHTDSSMEQNFNLTSDNK